MSCPICQKRPPKRFCPAKGEKICAVCCGRERESTLDCPMDCPHLVTAHRYESEHRKPVSAEEFPYREVRFSIDFVYERWPLVSGIGTIIVTVSSQHKDLHDADIYSALERLSETYRTLGTGLIYERPPDMPLQRELYQDLLNFLQHYQKTAAEQTGFAPSSEADMFKVLVFLLRMCKSETNGRPRSRAFLAFLRERFRLPPAQAAAAEGSRIIIP
jgi:hypothetical protein